jgi:hypothetical protein
VPAYGPLAHIRHRGWASPLRDARWWTRATPAPITDDLSAAEVAAAIRTAINRVATDLEITASIADAAPTRVVRHRAHVRAPVTQEQERTERRRTDELAALQYAHRCTPDAE